MLVLKELGKEICTRNILAHREQTPFCTRVEGKLFNFTLTDKVLMAVTMAACVEIKLLEMSAPGKKGKEGVGEIGVGVSTTQVPRIVFLKPVLQAHSVPFHALFGSRH